MSDDQRRWPGYRQDGEAARLVQERQRAEQIKADNLEARMRAADPVQRDRIDRSTGRTWRDAVTRGMYDDSRVQDYRDQNDRNRDTRERFRWAQARTQGRAGRN